MRGARWGGVGDCGWGGVGWAALDVGLVAAEHKHVHVALGELHQRRVLQPGLGLTRDGDGVPPRAQRDVRADALPDDLLGGAVAPPALGLHHVDRRAARPAHRLAGAVAVRAEPRAREGVDLEAVALAVDPLEQRRGGALGPRAAAAGGGDAEVDGRLEHEGRLVAQQHVVRARLRRGQLEVHRGAGRLVHGRGAVQVGAPREVGVRDRGREAVGRVQPLARLPARGGALTHLVPRREGEVLGLHHDEVRVEVGEVLRVLRRGRRQHRRHPEREWAPHHPPDPGVWKPVSGLDLLGAEPPLPSRPAVSPS